MLVFPQLTPHNMFLWSLWLRSCASTGKSLPAIANNSQSLENFIDSLQHERKAISIQKAWLAADQNSRTFINNKLVYHHWVILQCSSQDYTETSFLALHRFDDRIAVGIYSDFDGALQESELRPKQHPEATLIFESILAEERPARGSFGEHPLLARYIVPALRTQLKDYQQIGNNCQHFADFVLKSVKHAGEYLGLTKDKTAVSEYGETSLYPNCWDGLARAALGLALTAMWVPAPSEFKPDVQMQKLVYNTINQDLLQDGRAKKSARSEQTVKPVFAEKIDRPVPKKQPVKITAVASSTPLKTSTPNVDAVVTDDCGCVKMGCCLFVIFGVLVTCLCVPGSKAKKTRQDPDSNLLSLVGQ